MVNVLTKTCKVNNCKKIPCFNEVGETIGKYCASHKIDSMVNIHKHICNAPNCQNIPIFGYPGKKAIYCNQHRLNCMINVEERKICCVDECDLLAITNHEDKFYCIEHFPDRQKILLSRRQCKICDLAPTNNICKDCKSRRHRKEWEIVCLLRKKINLRPIHDSNRMVSECSRSRPDLFYQCLTHAVVVEIDEDQHKRYDEICECARLNKIVSSLGGLPVTFIRYNPDKIRNKGRLIKFNNSDRFDKLVCTVKNELNNPPEFFRVKLIQLYYDDNCDIYQPIKFIDITNSITI